VAELPPEYGFTVVSQKWNMSPAAAAALQAQQTSWKAARATKQPGFVNTLYPAAQGWRQGGEEEEAEWPEPEQSSTA
jgi:hypothetical protein